MTRLSFFLIVASMVVICHGCRLATPNFCAANPEIITCTVGWHDSGWWISRNRNYIYIDYCSIIPSHCSLTVCIEDMVCPLLFGCLCISKEHCVQKWALHCSQKLMDGPHSYHTLSVQLHDLHHLHVYVLSTLSRTALRPTQRLETG